METKQNKSYKGRLMKRGKSNEEILLRWLEKLGKRVVDYRDFEEFQSSDVDFGIVSNSGSEVLAEIKSDKHIGEDGNLCFEVHRINHFVKDSWFYLGWGWRSTAQILVVRNPETGETFIFNFAKLRSEIAKYVARVGKKLNILIIETDKQKTTFNWLIPMSELKHIYLKYEVR